MLPIDEPNSCWTLLGTWLIYTIRLQDLGTGTEPFRQEVFASFRLSLFLFYLIIRSYKNKS